MPDKFNPEIAPEWHAIKLDETPFYDDQFLEKYKVEKIYGVYLTDLKTRVYCCEITPSYELGFVQSSYEGGPDDEDAMEEFLRALEECDRTAEPFMYMHCRAVDGLPDDCKYPIALDDDDWQKDENDRDRDREFDAAYEIYTCNPAW